MERERAQAPVVLEEPSNQASRKQIVELAAAHRLPTVFPISMLDAGGLIAYGTSPLAVLERAPERRWQRLYSRFRAERRPDDGGEANRKSRIGARAPQGIRVSVPAASARPSQESA
jgi:hypothetical protein